MGEYASRRHMPTRLSEHRCLPAPEKEHPHKVCQNCPVGGTTFWFLSEDNPWVFKRQKGDREMCLPIALQAGCMWFSLRRVEGMQGDRQPAEVGTFKV